MRLTRERRKSELDAQAALMRARYRGCGRISPELALAAIGERSGRAAHNHMAAMRYRPTVTEIQEWEVA